MEGLLIMITHYYSIINMRLWLRQLGGNSWLWSTMNPDQAIYWHVLFKYEALASHISSLLDLRLVYYKTKAKIDITIRFWIYLLEVICSSFVNFRAIENLYNC
jgi:hypothetical protein